MTHRQLGEGYEEGSVHAETMSQDAVVGVARPIRLALITAGQSPRPQIYKDLAEALPEAVEITEFGALDSLTDAEVAALVPAPGHPSLATRMRDGRQILVSRQSSYRGIQAILSRWRPDEFDLVAICCTGAFDLFPPFSSPCRLIQSQPAMDNAVSMIVHSGHKIGVIQPNVRHMGEDVLGLATYQRQMTWLDASAESDWARVIAMARDCEALVLNSFDYDEQAAVRLRRETGLPVLLPRRVLASAIRLVLDVDQAPHAVHSAQATIMPLLERLTPRERQVMWLMVEGLQSKQIASQLEISPHTVSIHRANILSKLGVPSTNVLTRLILARPEHKRKQLGQI